MKNRNTNDQNPNYLAFKKIVFLGDAGVGKSNLVDCIIEDKPITGPSYLATMGPTFKTCMMKQVKAQICDVSGQDRFYKLNIGTLRGAHGVVIVYDITNTDSFANIKFWVENAEYIGSDLPILLLGTQCDLVSDRKIISEEAEAFSKTIPNCIAWAEVSSRDNFNVSNTFQQFIDALAKEELSLYQENKEQETEQKKINRYNRLTEGQKDYVTQLESVWKEANKNIKNQMESNNISLTLIKSVLDNYTKNNSVFGTLFSPSSWASNHISDVKIIAQSIISSNPTPNDIVTRLERLNPVSTGDVAAIIYFLKEKIDPELDFEENKTSKNKNRI